MRIAIISDIHGNAFAFKAVLGDVEEVRPDNVVCLGDAVQGGAQPAETVALLRALGAPVVMGNADSWLLTDETSGAEPVSEQQERVRQWSLSQLSAGDIDYMKDFQATFKVPLDDEKDLHCFHGSPASFDDLIFPETSDSDLEGLFGPDPSAILTGGHTHLQQLRRFRNSLFINPGSIGVAYARHQAPENFKLDPWAEYAVLSAGSGKLSVEFRRVPLDVSALRQTILASGVPGAEDAAARYA